MRQATTPAQERRAKMNLKQAKLEAKRAGLIFALEALENRFYNDLTSEVETKAYAYEIARLKAALNALYKGGTK
jgi:hypothetical protein